MFTFVQFRIFPVNLMLVVQDFLLRFLNLFIYPVVGALLILKQDKQRIDGREISSPESGGANGAKNRQNQPSAVRPSVTKRTEKVFHDRPESGESSANAGLSLPGAVSRCNTVTLCGQEGSKAVRVLLSSLASGVASALE